MSLLPSEPMFQCPHKKRRRFRCLWPKLDERQVAILTARLSCAGDLAQSEPARPDNLATSFTNFIARSVAEPLLTLRRKDLPMHFSDLSCQSFGFSFCANRSFSFIYNALFDPKSGICSNRLGKSAHAHMLPKRPSWNAGNVRSLVGSGLPYPNWMGGKAVIRSLSRRRPLPRPLLSFNAESSRPEIFRSFMRAGSTAV